MTNYQIKFAVGRVDRQNGVIYGVSLISTGPVLGHGLNADKTTLTSVLSACQRVGALKCKANHWADVQSICGTFSNYKIVGKKLLADLTLLKSNPSYEYILDIAEKLPTQIGLSIAFAPDIVETNGQKFVRCVGIFSADIVDSPASNPQGLFSDTTPALTNTATSIPTGVKAKTRTITVVCPNCEKHLETFSKLAVIHADAADKFEDYLNSVQVAQRDNISSQNTEAQFQARLAEQKLELEKSLDAKASIMASRMLSATGIKLSRIPDADTCNIDSSGDGILNQLDRITDPTEKGKFYRRNEKDIKIAFQHQADKKTQLENQR
jgi:transcription elongation factor Elf1